MHLTALDRGVVDVWAEGRRPKMNRQRRRLLRAIAALAVATAPFGTRAESYPSRPIRIVVGYGAGSTIDVRVRQFSDRLATALSTPVIVENRPGAAGTLGASHAARSAPDGYTLFYGGATELAVEPAFRRDLPYDVLQDFAPIMLVGSSPAILLINPGLGVRSIGELVALARSQPGRLSCATYGIGSLTHLLLLQLSREAGVEIAHAPYKNPAHGLVDVAGGHASMAFDYMVGAQALIAAGRLRPLLVVGSRRLSVLPDTPSAAEVGYPGLDRRGWAGFLAPAGTPPAVIGRLNHELGRILRSPEMLQVIAESGAEVIGSSPEAFAVFLREEQSKFAALIKVAGLRGN
jgi:tripartite-type tricarboxylate transporter receptor subunit TctC